MSAVLTWQRVVTDMSSCCPNATLLMTHRNRRYPYASENVERRWLVTLCNQDPYYAPSTGNDV